MDSGLCRIWRHIQSDFVAENGQDSSYPKQGYLWIVDCVYNGDIIYEEAESPNLRCSIRIIAR